MGIRLARHQETGIALARWLAARPEVNRVLHPAIETDPGHAIWARDFKGASGLFGMELKPVSGPAVRAFLDALKLFGMGYSWGGFESLIVPFDTSRDRALPSKFAGPTFRLHAGLEDLEDLTGDLDQAFHALANA